MGLDLIPVHAEGKKTHELNQKAMTEN